MNDEGFREGVSPGFIADSLAAFDAATAKMGLSPDSGSREIVGKWIEFYAKWPGRRVIGFTEPNDLAVKLLADSFSVHRLEKILRAPSIDLGSGNGWPGLALRGLGGLTLLDSRKGACDFMRGFVDYATIERVKVVEDRAEDAGASNEMSGKFGLVVSRAMASPATSLELAAAFVERGGSVILWLGPAHEDTVVRHPHIPELGLSLEGLHRYALPYEMGKRLLAVYRKEGKVSKGFPRKIAAARAKPLF